MRLIPEVISTMRNENKRASLGLIAFVMLALLPAKAGAVSSFTFEVVHADNEVKTYVASVGKVQEVKLPGSKWKCAVDIRPKDDEGFYGGFITCAHLSIDTGVISNIACSDSTHDQTLLRIEEGKARRVIKLFCNKP